MIATNNQTGQHKKHDTALRHKIRNLRAKVRLLLPLDLCCKQQKRSKNLIKMYQTRHQNCHSQQSRWNHGKQNVSELFIPSHSLQVEKHLFEKLTFAEIEQIKEDKLYYVGDEFIDHFDQFLETQAKQKVKNISQNKGTKGFEQLVGIPQLNHKSSLSFGDEAQYYERPNIRETKMKNMIRMEAIQAKRKQITENDQTRRAYIKIKGQQKQQKHIANYEKALAEKQHLIRQRNKANMLKTSQSIKRKNNCYQVGQINQLSEKLRGLCLQRYSRSTNLFSRG